MSLKQITFKPKIKLNHNSYIIFFSCMFFFLLFDPCHRFTLATKDLVIFTDNQCSLWATELGILGIWFDCFCDETLLKALKAPKEKLNTYVIYKNLVDHRTGLHRYLFRLSQAKLSKPSSPGFVYISLVFFSILMDFGPGGVPLGNLGRGVEPGFPNPNPYFWQKYSIFHHWPAHNIQSTQVSVYRMLLLVDH